MDFGPLLAILRRRWYLFALLPAVGAGLAYLGSSLQPERQAAGAQIRLEFREQTEATKKARQYDDTTKAYLASISGRRVLESTVESLGLETRASELRSALTVVVSRDGQIAEAIVEDKDAERAALIAKTITEVAINPALNPVAKNLQLSLVPETFAKAPPKPDRKVDTVLGGVLGLVLALGVGFKLEPLLQTSTMSILRPAAA